MAAGSDEVGATNNVAVQLRYGQDGTGSYGNFTVSCDLGYTYVEGYVRLRNLHAYATSEHNGAAGAFFSGFDGANLDLFVANDFAARVWLDLRERVPMAFSLSGRSKAR